MLSRCKWTHPDKVWKLRFKLVENLVNLRMCSRTVDYAGRYPNFTLRLAVIIRVDVDKTISRRLVLFLHLIFQWFRVFSHVTKSCNCWTKDWHCFASACWRLNESILFVPNAIDYGFHHIQLARIGFLEWKMNWDFVVNDEARLNLGFVN